MRFYGPASQIVRAIRVLSFTLLFGLALSANAQNPESYRPGQLILRKEVECRLNSGRIEIGFRNHTGQWKRYKKAQLKRVRPVRLQRARRLCREALLFQPEPSPTPEISPTPNPTSTPEPEPTQEPQRPTEWGNAGSPLGTNLSGVTYYSSELPFVDVMKLSSNWGSVQLYGAAHPEPLDLDEYGNIRSLLPAQNGLQAQVGSKAFFIDLAGNYPAGQYIVLYEGEGTLAYSGDAVKNSSLSAPGRDVLDVTPTQRGFFVKLVAVNPANYIRNMRIISPGGVCSESQFKSCRSSADCDGTCESFENNYATQIFHPDFLDRIKYAKVLRFMDWMRTNNSEQGVWANRPKVSDVTWADVKGIPLEIMIALANRLHTNPWFCMPHLANNDYINNFASMVRDNLDSDLTAHVEYSNELWNSIFTQSQYMTTQATALNLAPDIGLGRIRYQSQRSVEIFGIWQNVLGNAARLKRVIASQSANSWTGLKLLEWQDAFRQTDALAIAPYFGGRQGLPTTQHTVAAYTLDHFFEVLENEELPRAITAMEQNAANTQNFGVELITYEGGQHLVGVGGAENNQALTNLFIAANRDSRMGDLYRTYLSAWRQAGGGMFVNFSSTVKYNKWGSWGVFEYQNQAPSSAPKYMALMDYFAQYRTP